MIGSSRLIASIESERTAGDALDEGIGVGTGQDQVTIQRERLSGRDGAALVGFTWSRRRKRRTRAERVGIRTGLGGIAPADQLVPVDDLAALPGGDIYTRAPIATPAALGLRQDGALEADRVARRRHRAERLAHRHEARSGRPRRTVHEPKGITGAWYRLRSSYDETQALLHLREG